MFRGALVIATFTWLVPITLSAETIRVVVSGAALRLKADEGSAVVTAIPVGSVLSEVTREGNYYRVTLPPDAAGFRRVGYIAAAATEPIERDAEPIRAPARVTDVTSPAKAAAANASDIALAPRSTQVGRPSVAVLPFSLGTVRRWWSPYQWNVGQGVTDLTVDALVNHTGLEVVERERLASILAELELSNSGIAEPSVALRVQLGKQAGAQYLVVGSVTQFSYDENTSRAGGHGPLPRAVDLKTGTARVSVTARLIETTTGRIVASSTGDGTVTRRGVHMIGSSAYASTTPSRFEDSAVGEATRAAVKDCVDKLEASRRTRALR